MLFAKAIIIVSGSERVKSSLGNVLEDWKTIINKTKHAYSNIMRFLPPKNENVQIKKNSGSVHASVQNIDYGYLLELPRRCGSNEYPQSMFLSRNKKHNVYPCKPQFNCIKVV